MVKYTQIIFFFVNTVVPEVEIGILPWSMYNLDNQRNILHCHRVASYVSLFTK